MMKLFLATFNRKYYSEILDCFSVNNIDDPIYLENRWDPTKKRWKNEAFKTPINNYDRGGESNPHDGRRSQSIKDNLARTLVWVKKNNDDPGRGGGSNLLYIYNSMVSTLRNMITYIGGYIQFSIPVISATILYNRYKTHKFILSFRVRPFTDSSIPIPVEEVCSRVELYTRIAWLNSNKLYIYEKFDDIMKSLGLIGMKSLDLPFDNWDLAPKTYWGHGLKLLTLPSEPRVVSKLVEVKTLIYDPALRSYVHCMFVTLVHAGLLCTVWYKLVPGHPQMIPDNFDPVSIDIFNSPTAVVDGYKKITYLITKDIVQSVVDTFQNHPTFNNIINPADFTINSEVQRDTLSCICTGIMISMFLTIQILLPPGSVPPVPM